MGKNDDFAARHTRIREQTNAPDPTRGKITDPRQARALRPQPSSPSKVFGFMKPKFFFGGLAALALAAFVLGPQGDERHAGTAFFDQAHASLQATTIGHSLEGNQRLALLATADRIREPNISDVSNTNQRVLDTRSALNIQSADLITDVESE